MRFVYLLSVVSCCLLGSLLLSACRGTNQDPQPDQTPGPPTIRLSRTFTSPTGARSLTATYTATDMQHRVAGTVRSLRISLAIKQARTDGDELIMYIDSLGFKPGLVGNYTIPPIDTTTFTQAPRYLDVHYGYYQLVDITNATDGFRYFGGGRSSVLPGAYLSITNYDTTHRLLSGRFLFRFTLADPTSKDIFNRGPENWTATYAGEFTNLSVTR